MRVRINDNWSFALTGVDTPSDYDAITAPEIIFRSGILLPHDWLIYDTSDLYRDGLGIYKRSLSMPDELRGHYFLILDGVYMDYCVFVNGQKCGEWKYGYSQYVLEITHALHPGDNEIVIPVRYKSPNSRWYSGAGIYRDVWLMNTPGTYIPENGVYIHSRKTGSDYDLTVDVEIEGGDGRFSADAETGLSVTLEMNGARQLIPFESKICGAGGDNVFRFSSRIKSPGEWDIDDPCLHEIEVKLEVPSEGASGISGEEDPGDRQDIQVVRIPMGFRDVRLDPDRGFFLNGRHMKLNGVCEHHDLGLLGAEFNRSAMRRKLEILKKMGVNAVRGTHNMMAPGFPTLCDEMGILFISEAFDMWEHPKTEYDYARFFPEWHERDVRSWIRRDRNHVCVIMWSIGNEISDIHTDPVRGPEITRELMELVRTHDPSCNAYVTQGSNYMPWENAQICADILDAAGYNYAEKYYAKHHADNPSRIIYGSETSSIAQSRGIYHFPLALTTLGDDDEQCSALGNNPTSWGARSFEECALTDRDSEFSLGQFLWSGFDYIGEPTPYHTRSSYLGQIDTAGFPKDAYYFWKSMWTDPEKEPFVHIFPYWDFNPGQTVDVRVVSNLDEVELYLNGKSLGRQALDHKPGSGSHMIADYRIEYTPGELLALGFASGSREAAASHRRITPGSVQKLICEKYAFSTGHDEDELVFCEITAADREGNTVDNACDMVEAEVLGAGILIGMDNGDSTDPDGYRTSSKRLFGGRLLAVIKPDEGVCPEDIGIRVRISDRVRDVRKIELSSDSGRVLMPEDGDIRVNYRTEPGDARACDLNFAIMDESGTPSNLAEISKCDTSSAPGDNSGILTFKPKGDGRIRLRATCGDGFRKVKIISELDFEIRGYGQVFSDPYGFVYGSSLSSHIGEVTSGNEKGIATARGEKTVLIYSDIDFGRTGSDRITLPVFSLDFDRVPIRIWSGIPGEDDCELLLDAVYDKPREWNTYIEETFTLNRRLTGVRTLSIEVEQKIHLKGFSFEKLSDVGVKIRAVSADSIYGDSFVRTPDAVENIGNNVTLNFDGLDFGEEGRKRISITGRTPNTNNPIRIRLLKDSEEEVRVCEFTRAEAYETQTFDLPEVGGMWKIGFIFLPGSNFDFRSFEICEG